MQKLAYNSLTFPAYELYVTECSASQIGAKVDISQVLLNASDFKLPVSHFEVCSKSSSDNKTSLYMFSAE